MNKLIRQCLYCTSMLLLASVLVAPRDASAQVQAPNHVVSSADLQRDVSSASALRQQNIQEVENFLSRPGARQAVESAHINYQQVKDAVPQLSNQELAHLANMSQNAQKQFAAGSLSNRDLLWIIVVAAVIIIIIVAT
jgi:molecular chaperone DnaK (HSP70)